MSSHNIRTDYLLDSDLIYLNTAALGPTPQAVLHRILQASQELARYPSHDAKDGLDIFLAAEQVRETGARLLGCDAEELRLTCSTTGSMNAIAQSIRLNQGDRILTTDSEHDGGSWCWHYLARRDSAIIDTVSITRLDYDHHAILERLAAAINSNTRVISVSHVIASTGLRMPIDEIAALAREHGILCVVDGAQAIGNINVNLKSLGCHAYATSGYKWLMGPKGTGFIYVSHDASSAIQPIYWNNLHSYINPTLALGLGTAIKAVLSHNITTIEHHNIALRNRAYAGLLELSTIKILSPPPGPQATAILSFELPDDLDSEYLRVMLREKHRLVVKAVEKKWFNGIRISPHMFNDESDIDALLQALRVYIT